MNCLEMYSPAGVTRTIQTTRTGLKPNWKII